MIHRCSVFGVIAVVCILFSSSAFGSHSRIHAKENGYFGFAGISLDGDAYGFSGGVFISGLDLNNFLSVEGHLGAASSDSYTTTDAQITTDIDYFSSIRLRFNYHMQKMIPYFYLGYSGIHYSDTITTGNSTTNTDAGYGGLSYGVGIDLFGNHTTALFISTGVFIDNNGDNDNLDLRSALVGFRYYLSRKTALRFW